MAITNLTGTKWKFNTTILYSSNFSYEITGTISFSSENIIYTTPIPAPLSSRFKKIRFYKTSSGGGGLIIPSDDYFNDPNYGGVYYRLKENTWDGYYVKPNANIATKISNVDDVILEILGGTDVQSSALISWLQANATLIKVPPYYAIYDRNNVVKLAEAIRAKTGTTALLNHTKMIDVVNNINLQKEELEVTYNLDFTGGNMVDTAPTGKAFSKVTIVKPSTLIPSNILSPVEIAGVQGSIETYATPEALGKVYKFNTSPTIPNTAKTYTYNFKSNGTQYTYLAMGNNIITYANSGGEDIVYNNGWTNEEYRTLCFEEVPQGELLTMLNSNAIRQNGELYFTENGETTLATQGKYLDGNLKVIVNVPQLDTSDATATPSDIRYTKSAYVNGVKVEGSIQDYANETTNLFSITANLTNVSAIIPEYIEESETLMLIITADSGYALPDSISVSGCTYTYNKDSGEISLSGASSDVVISIVGVEEVTEDALAGNVGV